MTEAVIYCKQFRVYSTFYETVAVAEKKCVPNGPDVNIQIALFTILCHISLFQLAMMIYATVMHRKNKRIAVAELHKVGMKTTDTTLKRFRETGGNEDHSRKVCPTTPVTPENIKRPVAKFNEIRNIQSSK
ncbi:hypothetical protein KIN20_017050 [Parelaphostrongylus tenuis]|uniref:Uncharacterized protein n=1 Tax=Parelaphostrongylus tenuis TaxID=148309 RepID=A0AAD5N0D8_PARTN|nr:hypothetical protein KIN20_017050 [Parelaphostrongylus tenuis]